MNERRQVPCPRCPNKKTRVIFTALGEQHRECRKCGHRFIYDRWMADRLMWAPGAAGSLTKEEDYFFG